MENVEIVFMLFCLYVSVFLAIPPHAISAQKNVGQPSFPDDFHISLCPEGESRLQGTILGGTEYPSLVQVS